MTNPTYTEILTDPNFAKKLTKYVFFKTKRVYKI
jgi:hypothetical protein